MKKILLTGASGQVGRELRRTLAPLGDVIVAERNTLDLAQPDTIRTTLRRCAPDIIINAAAYTAVDKAETEQELAFAVNGLAPGILAEEAKHLDALLIHYSTDYVFDGTRATPYCEDDIPNPLNAYGHGKLAGERAIAATTARHVILRTSWVYGSHGNNFARTILRLARERTELRIVDDQIGAPTWSRTLAEATAAIITQYSRTPNLTQDEQHGVFHLSARGATSWCGFAQAILSAAAEHDARYPIPRLTPISTADYPTPARRPLYSLLANDRIRASFGIELPDWQTSLALCMRELSGNAEISTGNAPRA